MNKCFQLGVILLLLQALPYARAEAPPSPKWLAGITRVAYTDLPNSHRRADWPDRVILDFASAGVQMMFSRVHNGRDAPGLGWRSAYGDADPAMQGRDGTREVVALCRKHNIRYLAYYWAQMEPESVGTAHPEWRMLNSAGKPNGYYCGNTGYQEPVIRVMTMMTNGCVPAHSVPGRDVMARYMADIAAREEYLRDARLYPWCGLVVSEKTERWYGRDDPQGRYVKGIYGAYQALLERHLPVTLVTDRELERGLQDRYAVLFLPNGAAMSDVEMETVRNYVRDGGAVVATFETSLYDEHGQPRADLGLGDLLQAKCIGKLDSPSMFPPAAGHSAHFGFSPSAPWSDNPIIRRTLEVRDVSLPVDTVSRSVPLHGRMLLVAPTNGRPSALRLKTSTRDATSGAATLQTTVAMVESNYGKGKVIYLPCDVSGAYFRYGHEYLARLMELALRQVAAEPPPVEVEAPSIIEAMPQVQGERLVVHLLNDISSFGRSQNVAGESLYLRREVIPVHDVAVTFRDRHWQRFLLVPGKIPLTPVDTPQGPKVIVPRLETHCLIVAETDHAGQFPGTTTVRVACREEPVAGKTRSGESGVLERQAGGADDLLRDGSCEQGNGGTLPCWHLAQPRGGTVVIGACTENPRDGAACMSLRGIADWACGESERIAVRKGNVYKLRGWARATRGDVFLQISYWRGNEWLGLTQSDAVTTDGQWQQCVASTEPDRFADATHVSISGTARGGNVEAWFDAMVFTPETSPRKP